MAYTILKPIPPVAEIRRALPLAEHVQQKIYRNRLEIQRILRGEDSRLLMIVGPCSAWPAPAVLTYAERLATLAEELKHVMKIVMRVYIHKPRTVHGWAGPLQQPNPFAAPDLIAGLYYCREMMLKVLALGVPIADEALCLENSDIFLELLSWLAIGARSTTNPTHRIFASTVDCPVGLKNPIEGGSLLGVHSVAVAQQVHTTRQGNFIIQTSGNPYAHLVLRGTNFLPNYSIAHLIEIKQYLLKYAIQNPAILIDASHDNAIEHGEKDYHLQTKVILSTLEQLSHHATLRPFVKGFMIESFLHEGQQRINLSDPAALDWQGLSITDACLGWTQTAELLYDIAQHRVTQMNHQLLAVTE